MTGLSSCRPVAPVAKADRTDPFRPIPARTSPAPAANPVLINRSGILGREKRHHNWLIKSERTGG
jgi:hypothetical protein